MKNKQAVCNVTRREVLKTLVGGAVATIFSNQAASAVEAPGPSKAGKNATGPYNILFILTDQERYFRPGELPKDFHLPAHERLVKKGIVFENHRINSCVCTPSRSVLYTGQHIEHTRMFDNTNF